MAVAPGNPHSQGLPTVRRKKRTEGFLESDGIRTLDLRRDGCLLTIAESFDSPMKGLTTAHLSRACAASLEAAASQYATDPCRFVNERCLDFFQYIA